MGRAKTMTPMEKVNRVNEILLAGEPENITEESRGSQTYTGYSPQYIIDAMNGVFGLGEWGFDEISNEIVDVPTKNGVQVRAVAQVRVWLKGVDFKPPAYGQANLTMGDIGDAKKGAQTDAIKKALSYFSIGNRAYRGLLPSEKQRQANQRIVKKTSAVVANPVQVEAKGADPKPTQDEEKPPTSKELFALGSEAGMWSSGEEYLKEVSVLLNMEVKRETRLPLEQRQMLAQIIKESVASKAIEPAQAPQEQKSQLAVVEDAKSKEQPASDQQIRSIRNLCGALSRSVPDGIGTISSVDAGALIKKLSSDQRAARKAS
jgi:recombination DNA repair RAD52 pathway protein